MAAVQYEQFASRCTVMVESCRPDHVYENGMLPVLKLVGATFEKLAFAPADT